jgi:hypothetical protein
MALPIVDSIAVSTLNEIDGFGVSHITANILPRSNE